MEDRTAEEQEERSAQGYEKVLPCCLVCELPLGQGDCPRCASLETIKKRGGPMVMA